MNFEDLLDSATAASLDIAWLRDALAPVSEAGRRHARTVRPYAPGEEAAARSHAGEITRFGRDVSPERVEELRERLRSFPDPLTELSKANAGDALTDPNLFVLACYAQAVDGVAKLLPQYAALPRDSAAQDLRRLLEPGRSGPFAFYLADEFDAELPALRERARESQAAYGQARERLAADVAKHLAREDIPQGEFIVMRDSPIPRGVRVIREAPTYVLCELDLDEPALEALSNRDAAAADVARREARVRENLSAAVRERSADLERELAHLGKLDVFLAAVRFTQKHGCVPATEGARGLMMSEARDLPLEERVRREERRYVPIAIDVEDVAIVTGPNMGGKSAALRTCGFIAAIAAFGIPVPARAARIPLFDRIAWLGITDGDDPGGLLSTYAREVLRLKSSLMHGGSVLLLADEFARTTTPHEGRALLTALAWGLRRRGCTALFATHLPGVAAASGARHFAVRGLRAAPKAVAGGDVHAALAALAESMDYTLEEVAPGSEDSGGAIALAALLGLDEDIVADAQAALNALS